MMHTFNNLPLFSGLMPDERAALLRAGQARSFAAGEVLFHHGDPLSHFYVVVRGTLQLYRTTSDGRQKTLELLKAGQTLGETEIMDSCKTHRMSAAAVDQVEVIVFPAVWLKQAAQNHSTLALNLLSQIAGQMHDAAIEAEHQATMTAPQLVACFLQRLCVLHNFNPRDFTLPYSKSLIASRLGMEPETFSRTLAKLKEHGIEVAGNRVIIRNLTQIEHYVCAFCSVAGECATHQVMERKLGSDSGCKKTH